MPQLNLSHFDEGCFSNIKLCWPTAVRLILLLIFNQWISKWTECSVLKYTPAENLKLVQIHHSVYHNRAVRSPLLWAMFIVNPLWLNNLKIFGEISQLSIFLMNTGWNIERWISQGLIFTRNSNEIHHVKNKKKKNIQPLINIQSCLPFPYATINDSIATILHSAYRTTQADPEFASEFIGTPTSRGDVEFSEQRFNVQPSRSFFLRITTHHLAASTTGTCITPTSAASY